VSHRKPCYCVTIRADWGDVCFDDACANDHALAQGGRLFSAYSVGTDKVWIITEADRLYTTLLTPEDY
jgi:hypothetical protein